MKQDRKEVQRSSKKQFIMAGDRIVNLTKSEPWETKRLNQSANNTVAPKCGTSLGGRERVSTLRGDLHQIHCKITASQIPMKDGVMQSVTFVDGHCVQHTVTRIHHEARRPSRCVQRQDSLGRQVHGVHDENLKDDLRHALSVSLGVQNKTGCSSGATLSSL